jgi:hypothetical protein
MSTFILDAVLPGQQKTHDIVVPPGLTSANFGLYWLDDNPTTAMPNGPQLGMTLRRPDTSVVNPGAPDLLDSVDITDEGFLYMLLRGRVMNAPAAGTWQVTVDGTSVPPEGRAYIVAMMPDTNVALSLEPAEPTVLPGVQQIVTAVLYDGETPIATTSVTASVLTPPDADSVPLTLADNGEPPDKAIDNIYTGAFTATTACGGYRIRASASGTSATEGSVTREQIASFDVAVAGDEVRDPCNPDEDGDGLSDTDELDRGTDPYDPDMDDDSCPDGKEVGTVAGNGGLRDPENFWDFFDTPLVASTNLTADMTTEAVPPFDINVTSVPATFPTPSTWPGAVYIEGEKFLYDSKTTNSFHIVARAVDGTVAAQHGSGAQVAAAVRDRSITISEIARVVGRFGSSQMPPPAGDEAVAQALTPPPPQPAYHTAFDRSYAGPPNWRTGAPNGAVTVQDITLAVAQFGHNCNDLGP